MTETKPNILVIEDEPNLREGLKHNLELDGYEVDTAATGSAGLEKAMQNGHTLILLDLMLPEVDGIEILGSWNDFAFPSLPIASLTMTLVGIAYVLVPAGRHRRYVLLSVSGVVAAVGSARIYLAVDRLTDGLAAAILAATTAVLVFRIWTPEAVFPSSARSIRWVPTFRKVTPTPASASRISDPSASRPDSDELILTSGT